MKKFIYVGMGAGRFSSTCNGSISRVFVDQSDVAIAIKCSCGSIHMLAYQFDDATYSVLSHTKFDEGDIAPFLGGKTCLDTSVLVN